VGAHAITLVGYIDDDQLPGGGAFIFRNSWGSQWAYKGSPRRLYPAGYGLIPYAYIEKYGFGAYSLIKEVVSDHKDLVYVTSLLAKGATVAALLMVVAAFILHWSTTELANAEVVSSLPGKATEVSGISVVPVEDVTVPTALTEDDLFDDDLWLWNPEIHVIDSSKNTQMRPQDQYLLAMSTLWKIEAMLRNARSAM